MPVSPEAPRGAGKETRTNRGFLVICTASSASGGIVFAIMDIELMAQP
jgi:hypothetical protein